MALPFNTPSPAYVLGRDGSWAMVWMPGRDQLLWIDLERVPFENLGLQEPGIEERGLEEDLDPTP